MKKSLIYILLILMLCGCKKEEIEDEKISSRGELICVYKEQNVNENTIYTSYYIYNFDKNGILRSATNHEEIEFNDSSDEVKNNYKESIKDIIKEYKGIDGIEVSTKYDKELYYFEVKMDKSKMNEEIKEKFLLDQDRMSLYKKYTRDRYTCE